MNSQMREKLAILNLSAAVIKLKEIFYARISHRDEITRYFKSLVVPPRLISLVPNILASVSTAHFTHWAGTPLKLFSNLLK